MKLCFALLYHEPAWTDPRAYLDATVLHRHLPEALAARGHDVGVVVLFGANHRFRQGGVSYVFVPAPGGVRAVAAVAGRVLGRPGALFEPAPGAVAAIRRMRPDVVHFHGTHLHLNLLLLQWLGGRAPLVVHSHGGFVPGRAVVRALQRRSFARVDRFLFTTHDHAAPFVAAGLIPDAGRVVPFMETSSAFRMLPRDACRRRTGMTGDPVVLWTGRLHPVKDPLTALRAFEAMLADRPGARLYAYYRTDELLPEVMTFLLERPHLAPHVHLRGAAPFDEMEAIYNSADLFLQASRREFSGCAVLEAMACGVLPVVTDLPSFRAMTAEGRHGVLFPPGNATAAAAGLRSIRPGDLAARRVQVRAHFERALSFPALAARLEGVYTDVAAARRGRVA